MRRRRVRTAHPVVLAAAAIVLGPLLLRGWAVSGSWFFQDDFLLGTRASRGLTADFLLQDYSGHLMPGALLLVWLVTHLAPLEWGPPAAVLVALHLAAGVVMARTVLLVLGRRAVALVPLAAFVLSPLTLNSSLWWASGLQALPHQLALVVAVDGHLRYQQSRARRHAAQSLLAVAAGLAFYEKVVLVPLLLLLLSLLPLAAERGAGRLRAPRADRGYWAAHLLLGSTYTVGYLALTRGPGGAASPPGDWITVTGEALRTVAVALAGGPWRAEGDLPVAVHATPPALVVGAVAAGLLAFVGWTVVRGGRRARDAWLVLVAYLAVDIGLLIAERGELAPFLASDPRYYADAAAVVALTTALALRAVHDAGRATGTQTRPVVRSAALVAAAAVVVGSVQTTVVLADQAARQSARGYVERMRDALHADPGLVLADSPAARVALVDAFLGGQASVATVLGPLPEAGRLRASGPRAGVFTREGRLVEGVGLDPAVAARGPDGECGREVGVEPFAVRLPGRSPAAPGHLRLTWFTGETRPGVVEVDGVRHELVFEQGLHAWWIPVGGAVDRVVVQAVLPGPVPVCLTEVAVLTLWPPGG